MTASLLRLPSARQGLGDANDGTSHWGSGVPAYKSQSVATEQHARAADSWPTASFAEHVRAEFVWHLQLTLIGGR